jgi:hypothetical protein
MTMGWIAQALRMGTKTYLSHLLVLAWKGEETKTLSDLAKLRADPFNKLYFQPGREDFRQALQSAMPKLLTNGHKTPREEMRKRIETVKPKALRERLLKVWAKW